jgi:hypothetical protein
VDYSIKAAELVYLLGNSPDPSDGGEVPGDNPSGAGCRREGVATSTFVSPVQHNLMALLNQEPGRHKAEAVR